MNTVKTPLVALLLTAILSGLVAGCSAMNQDADYSGAADQSYSAPPPPAEDKES